ncbi:MAG: P-type HAD superfamily ATPase, Ca2+-transporting ATPase [Candidatus Gottesmanbacteria bacterium GW2011_GWA2_43_14]|uniref:P-type HAD superfamily ATPase, Ca2+-transporting ATPase n=1 Tax=Candidatus Gottesmanbacteria bacterium GW2011_GWA2_43_14 TaxID=1618443 RepID=A0A0G1FJY3_9BACT|nr:MAG: P-type HAD superfamily ATPase, Ca2+-transporting ATPase [Candidatus Gottesmanbacteria bacterium GW2011_GWA2_43_14]
MYYKKTVEKIVSELKTDLELGLSLHEAKRRLAEYGPNSLPEKPKPPLILNFIGQFKNLLVFILLIAAIISLLLGDALDAIAIFSIVLVNATIGFVQEIQAERTLESLKQKEILKATVVRDGTINEIPAAELVIGDVIILEEGQKIPADARVAESFSLQVDESILTGESLSVFKDVKELNRELPLADWTNILFKDTEAVSGRGKAVVIAIGATTQIGKIAQALHDTSDEKTPLTLELEKVGRMLTTVIGIIALSVFFLNLLQNISWVESLLISISLAVAAIPEGLPAIVTVVLSLGVKRLAERKSIIKKLPATETLGAVRMIATDKTGTLTQNKINVVKIISDKFKISVQGIGYQLSGKFYDQKGKALKVENNPALKTLLTAGVLANNAVLKLGSGDTKPLGDATEAALLVAAYRAGLDPETIKKQQTRVFELPFSSERKMMSVISLNRQGSYYLYSKGAPEIMMNLLNLPQGGKEKIMAENELLAKDGLRVLLLAGKKLSRKDAEKAIKNNKVSEAGLEYLGLAAMQDPLRPEVKSAIAQAKRAGIRTIMITGDHKDTARTIAREAGIIGADEAILTEDDIGKMAVKELSIAIENGASVFARISPLGKLKIIEAIKQIPGTQVAVTGDGVNDAPALKASHIGIAMGQTGTDITREVADMVITDDNYATIVDAIREGRVIFANLVKFIRYLISCNLSEVIVVTAAVLFGTPIPLFPIQILWVNLVTDGFPALALGMDPPEYDVMKRPPRDLSQGLLHRKRWIYMLIEGSVIGISTFLLFLFALSRYNYAVAQTMAFSTLAFAQLVHAFNNRSTRLSLFKMGFFSNHYLVSAAAVSIMLQYLVVQSAFGNRIFKTAGLTATEWGYIAVFSLIPLLFVEIKKQLRFKFLP